MVQPSTSHPHPSSQVAISNALQRASSLLVLPMGVCPYFTIAPLLYNASQFPDARVLWIACGGHWQSERACRFYQEYGRDSRTRMHACHHDDPTLPRSPTRRYFSHHELSSMVNVFHGVPTTTSGSPFATSHPPASGGQWGASFAFCSCKDFLACGEGYVSTTKPKRSMEERRASRISTTDPPTTTRAAKLTSITLLVVENAGWDEGFQWMCSSPHPLHQVVHRNPSARVVGISHAPATSKDQLAKICDALPITQILPIGANDENMRSTTSAITCRYITHSSTCTRVPASQDIIPRAPNA